MEVNEIINGGLGDARVEAIRWTDNDLLITFNPLIHNTIRIYSISHH
jgi:hypothetical protein